MIGDSSDILRRLRLTLPNRWFADVTPVLDSLLGGFASIWAGLYGLLTFTIQQSRVRTATGEFLDSAALDFLSDGLPRREQEQDDAFRVRLLSALQRSGATKAAVTAAAADAGYTVFVFEAANPNNTGAYNVAESLAWGTFGAWGSMQMPFESLLVAKSGANAVEEELWRNLSRVTPAGGVLWLHIDDAG